MVIMCLCLVGTLGQEEAAEGSTDSAWSKHETVSRNYRVWEAQSAGKPEGIRISPDK